ncbi:TM2 domain-containing protein [Olivibacter sitiensis]|uniref:TM2 domain-containing protein n=1 Tax=Olivibacter sitiensis TaxID=376470 RepID=UPI0003F68B40|nr:TM2 domain-containing protein [Olivibacter sitiensis]
MKNYFYSIPGLTPSEMYYIQSLTKELSEEKVKEFVYFYTAKRKSEQDILLFTLLGLIGIAGIQRFMLGQIALGIIYFITGGLCLIGTIVDLINYKQLTEKFNQTAALESLQMIGVGNPFL